MTLWALSMAFCKTASVGLVFMLFSVFSCTVNSTTTRYFTYEEDAPGTEIGNLSQDLKIDPADDLDTSFNFMQEINTSVIHMRESDGLLTVANVIDREQLCPRSRRCFIAFDIVAHSREKFQLIHVEIEVKDINDHSPYFPFNETRLEIVENVPLESRFPLQIALDEDVGENYIQSYNISPCSHFAVEVRELEDGVKFAELVLVSELDREMEDSYTIQVTASDGGATPMFGSMTVNIKVLDFNDNSPSFEHSSLKVELNEDSPIGHRIIKVHAFDPDQGINGEVVYAFPDELSTEAAETFHIDPYSGDVTLKALVDFEKRTSYQLRIRASDQGENSVPSTCTVVIEVVDVNDNAPEIRIKPMTSSSDAVAYITEAAAAESFVALISTSDRDSGSNGYVRVSLLGHEHFSLRQAYGDTFMIVTTATLDREKIQEYNLTVVAEDLGTPPFKTVRQYTISVTDENDNPPYFSKSVYEVSVLENNIPGSYITTVVARDPDMGKNAKVSYKLLDSEIPGDSPMSTYVSVDSLSGSLYTLRSFDYETLQQIEVVIQAEDRGSPPLSSTSMIRIRVVDQNDNYPYFTFPLLLNNSADIPLPYNAPSGYLALHVLAEDVDEGVNGELSYQILQGDPKLFSINKNTGEIALKQWLTAAIGDVLEMKITVSDNGRAPLSSSATIRFVVSDAEPPEDQVVIVLRSSEEEGSSFNGSLIIIIVLSGGCAFLLIAIVAVSLTCKLSCRGRRSHGRKREVCQGLFDGRPHPMLSSAEPNIYTGQQGFFHERASLSLDDSCLYEERSRDSESKIFLPSKHFQPTSVWQGDRYSLQVRLSNNDQLSVKDSGKGDSDFNDSDSDISGDGGKKNFSTFQPRLKSAANSLSRDCQSAYCAIPQRSYRNSRENAYTIGFSPMPVFNNPHSIRKDCGYGTNQPKPRSSMQTFLRSGTLPSYFPQQPHEAGAGQQATVHEEIPNIVTVATESEVATIF
ncbi:protocadherin-8 isoform X2 [Girardinichthys multiradiatus]|uniref:protocadherin-8 isoform X2 n=1 Tax=Girardinichthys multiradiatus TaxID=208333 RepID=UPI001FAE03E8|nr:protocadherin-8 isoform X2 [Girardinichthys multiradiatus]